MSDAKAKYEILLRNLSDVMVHEDAADKIREKMELPWSEMTIAEQVEMRKLSSDLYKLSKEPNSCCSRPKMHEVNNDIDNMDFLLCINCFTLFVNKGLSMPRYGAYSAPSFLKIREWES